MMNELFVDNFAGGGGASTGIEMAIGRSVDIAINHDPHAIAMHTTNHPETAHYCESVFDIDPVQATAGKLVALCWFSPDCRHFSKAKGKKPVKKEIRGLAWVVLRWAMDVKMRVGMLENVEEFQTWGPTMTDDNGDEVPNPALAGTTFTAFVKMLTTGIEDTDPGYIEACGFLNLSPTSKKARQLVRGLGYAVEHREMKADDYGAPTIRRRFFMVMRRDGKPIVWPTPTHADPRKISQWLGELKKWRTIGECIDFSRPCPSIFDRKRPLAENTMKRIARGLERFVLNNPEPFIVKCNHTTKDGSYDAFRGQSIHEPLKTITRTHGFAVVTPYIARIGQTGFNGDRSAYDLRRPLTTITSKAEHLLVSPILVGAGGAEYQGRPTSLDKPGRTVTQHNRTALVAAFLAKHFGGNYTGPGADLAKPGHTITTVDHHALVTSHLIKFRGSCKDGQTLDTPAPTITSQGKHLGEVRAFLLKYYGTNIGQPLDEPAHTVTTKPRFGLVTVEGEDYQIVDIGMRMLQPDELYRAQGFPEWYIIDQDWQGNKYAKDKQVARCGNAVPPQFAEALVRANLPEYCSAEKSEAA